MSIGGDGGYMSMGVVNTLLIAVVVVTAVFVWKKTVGRFSGYINGMIGLFLFSVMACLIVFVIVAVAYRGATSVDEIIAMLL